MQYLSSDAFFRKEKVFIRIFLIFNIFLSLVSLFTTAYGANLAVTTSMSVESHARVVDLLFSSGAITGNREEVEREVKSKCTTLVKSS